MSPFSTMIYIRIPFKNHVWPNVIVKISIPKVKIAVLKNLPIFGEKYLPQSVRLLEGRGVEMLFGSMPFEHALSLHGASLRGSTMICWWWYTDCLLKCKWCRTFRIRTLSRWTSTNAMVALHTHGFVRWMKDKVTWGHGSYVYWFPPRVLSNFDAACCYIVRLKQIWTTLTKVIF